MNKLIRFYNQNRFVIWISIILVAIVIVVIQVLNQFAYEKNAEKNVNEVSTNKTVLNNNYSVVTGQEVKPEVKDVIEEFINLCSNKQISMAYELLSTKCKEELYPTLEDFSEKYYNKIFSAKKTYICQAWLTEKSKYTYKIDFVDDMLATGSPSKTSIVDYYTVVKEENEDKLNINKFIDSENLNSAITKDNITIKVLSKKIYMDYEVYSIEVENKTQKTILLDNLKHTDKIYILDSNGKKYFWNNYEFSENTLTVRSGLKQKIEIIFNKQYSPNNKTENIVFENIVQAGKLININVDI